MRTCKHLRDDSDSNGFGFEYCRETLRLCGCLGQNHLCECNPIRFEEGTFIECLNLEQSIHGVEHE